MLHNQVVELEISLDETREQYNNVLRTSNNRAQQKKMMFLERNLEQLTVVQRQLVEQNSSLKKEVAIAERKLIARNERIQSLESLLQDSQEKLTAANHRYVETLKLATSVLTVSQIRSSTHSCKRTSRSREGWLDPRSRLAYLRRVVCVWRIRWLKDRETAQRWRWSGARWARVTCIGAVTGAGEGRGWKEDELVF
jgi:hypothetical protein